MSFLELHKSETRKLNILGKEFEFKVLSLKQYSEIQKAVESNNAESIFELIPDVIEKNIVGQSVTKEQIKETFSIDEIVNISMDLITGFGNVDEAGKD